jgi:hypothetical protein
VAAGSSRSYIQLPFAGFALTLNQIATANAAQAVPALTTALNAVPLASQFLAALNALSPRTTRSGLTLPSPTRPRWPTTSRAIDFPGTSAAATSFTRGHQWTTGFTVGQDLKSGHLTVSPFGGLLACRWKEGQQLHRPGRR